VLGRTDDFVNDLRTPHHRSADIDDPLDRHRRGAGSRGLPSLWLGATVACLTALGLVLGSLDGSSPAPSVLAIGDEDTATVPSSNPNASTGSSVPVAPATTTTVPVAPVLVAGASIPPLADLISRVGGGRVEVVSVVPQGVDGHTYEPTPSDVADITRADVTFFASVDLNPAVTRTVEANLAPGAVTVDLLETTMTGDEVIVDNVHSHGSGNEHGHANVHTWTDPTIGLRWVEEIRARLSELDPSGAEVYASNAADLAAQITALHEATVAATATVPPEFRTLVVYHDSWSYFGRTYGYEVLGALQAADFAEPSASEVANMVEQVRSAGVPAFFGAAVFPVEVLQRVSEEAGVPYVADLADDELPGQPGDPEHGYIGMMVENVRHIVTSLGGDASALDGIAL
jgi:ABC-type Zn uptake system ZnuABC Zn-binding protein ZnuA